MEIRDVIKMMNFEGKFLIDFIIDTFENVL
jgi:hypothetical protein